MKISTKGRYALRLMLDLAQHYNEGKISLRDISQRQDISMKYLEQIVSPLSKAGLILSTRGALGGYTLTKEPKDYTPKDILEVVEGPITCVACLEKSPNTCPRCHECPTLPIYEGLNKVILDYLSSFTLADLVEQNKNKKWDYVI